jgi:hypothetical protein
VTKLRLGALIRKYYLSYTKQNIFKLKRFVVVISTKALSVLAFLVAFEGCENLVDDFTKTFSVLKNSLFQECVKPKWRNTFTLPHMMLCLKEMAAVASTSFDWTASRSFIAR